MEILDFMNTHSNWEEIIAQPPYCITVKRDGDYILLKYNQFGSDFSLQIVRECRGSIFYKNENGMYQCVCRAFDKFGNYNESYVPKIDWNSAVVEEKVDGSLIKAWNHNNQWHVSTNGTIDAYKAEVTDSGWTFGRLFDVAIEGMFVSDFLNHLDTNCTYMFELVSPRSRVTISYPRTQLYYLGCRNMRTMKESKDDNPWMKQAGIIYPKVYKLSTLEDCLEYVKTMTKDEEGFVIRDQSFNRMKLKSPEYLLAFHMNNNGVITKKRIVQMILNEQLDDFLAYCPEYKEMVDEVKAEIDNISVTMNNTWDLCKDVAPRCNREVFSCYIKRMPYQDYLWNKYKNPELHSMDYIMSRPMAQIRRMMERNK